MLKKSASILAMSLFVASGCLAADTADNEAALQQVIESRSAEDRARDSARHPAETLAFFQVEPGMTIAELLPGKGWYTAILANYLGPEGTLYGINYSDRMWPLFPNATEEWIAARKQVTAEFPGMVAGFTDNGIKTASFTINQVSPDLTGTVDRVLIIRGLHNLNRFEKQAGTRTKALAAVHAVLKDDGMVGVVQHRAPESAGADWADGSHGYMDEAAVILMFEEAGFQLVAASEINANPLDQPSENDMVWRLPPSLRGSAEDAEQRAAMLAIGESDRMTLLFRKAVQ